MGAKQPQPQRISKPTRSPPAHVKKAPHLLGGFGPCSRTDGSTVTSGNMNQTCADADGAAFNFSACRDAYMQLVYGVDATNPKDNGAGTGKTQFAFYFNSGMYFTMTNSYLNANLSPSWIMSAGQTVLNPIGNMLTEFHYLPGSDNKSNNGTLYWQPTLTVTPDNQTFAAAKYTFESVTGSDSILVRVAQYGGGVNWARNDYYLMFTAVGNVYVSNLVPRQAALAAGVKFGVVASGSTLAGANTAMVLLYTDNTLSGKTYVVSLIGGNDAVSSTSIPWLPPSQIVASSTTAAGSIQWLYHGFYVSPSAANGTNVFDTSTLTYCDVTMQLTVNPDNNLPKQSVFNLALWMLDLAPDPVSGSTKTFMTNFMESYCSGVTTADDKSTVTWFNGKLGGSPNAYLCTNARNFDVINGDAFLMNLCGVNPVTKTPYAKGSGQYASDAILATKDCSCINYSQSTYAQPVLLNKNYADFQTYLSNNNINFQPGGDYRCWWPSCVDGQTGALRVSTMNTDRGTCPNNTICIAAVTNQSAQGGSNVINNIVNSCGNTNAGSPSSAASPSTSPTTSPSKSIMDQSWFLPVVIGGGIVLVLIVFVYVIRATRVNQASAGGSIVYVTEQ